MMLRLIVWSLYSTVAYVPPWIERVKELQSTAAINGEAERQVTKLGEEIKVLVREMRSKVRNPLPRSANFALIKSVMYRTKHIRKHKSKSIICHREWNPSRSNQRRLPLCVGNY